MFAGAVLEPILAGVAVGVARLDARRSIPIGPFPTEGFAEAGAGADQAIMQRRLAHPARRFVLAERPMRGVEEPQALRDARTQVFAIDLERHVAPDIDFPQIERRVSVADPLGNDFADAAGRLQSDGIEPGRDETVLELRRLAEM